LQMCCIGGHSKPSVADRASAVSSFGGFGRRPPNTSRRPSSGLHPKPFTEADSP
jgi:hypothetical protein